MRSFHSKTRLPDGMRKSQSGRRICKNKLFRAIQSKPGRLGGFQLKLQFVRNQRDELTIIFLYLSFQKHRFLYLGSCIILTSSKAYKKKYYMIMPLNGCITMQSSTELSIMKTYKLVTLYY